MRRRSAAPQLRFHLGGDRVPRGGSGAAERNYRGHGRPAIVRAARNREWVARRCRASACPDWWRRVKAQRPASSRTTIEVLAFRNGRVVRKRYWSGAAERILTPVARAVIAGVRIAARPAAPTGIAGLRQHGGVGLVNAPAINRLLVRRIGVGRIRVGIARVVGAAVIAIGRSERQAA